jgi:hypothetical protein
MSDKTYPDVAMGVDELDVGCRCENGCEEVDSPHPVLFEEV